MIVRLKVGCLLAHEAVHVWVSKHGTCWQRTSVRGGKVATAKGKLDKKVRDVCTGQTGYLDEQPKKLCGQGADVSGGESKMSWSV